MRFLGIGIQELLVILIIALLIFGAAKLPEIGKALAKTINEFKKTLSDKNDDDKSNKG